MSVTEPSWVTVATYDYPHEARLAQTMLDAAEIPTSLSDDHLVDAFPFYANAIGGIKLRVLEEHGEEARELLADVEAPPLRDRSTRTGWWSLVVLMGAWPVAIIGAVSWLWRGGKDSE